MSSPHLSLSELQLPRKPHVGGKWSKLRSWSHWIEECTTEVTRARNTSLLELATEIGGWNWGEGGARRQWLLLISACPDSFKLKIKKYMFKSVYALIKKGETVYCKCNFYIFINHSLQARLKLVYLVTCYIIQKVYIHAPP